MIFFSSRLFALNSDTDSQTYVSKDYNSDYWPQGSWDLAATKGAYWTWLNGLYPGDLCKVDVNHSLYHIVLAESTFVPTWVTYAVCIPMEWSHATFELDLSCVTREPFSIFEPKRKSKD